MIGSSLESMITLYTQEEETKQFIEGNEELFAFLFKVSKAQILVSEEDDTEEYSSLKLKVGVKKADGSKCARCWNYRETVGQSKEFSDLCERCYNVMSERRKNG